MDCAALQTEWGVRCTVPPGVKGAGGATNAPSRKEGDVETLFHVLGCVYYAVGTVYYIVTLVKLARSKERE